MKRKNSLSVSKVFFTAVVFILVTGSLSAWVYYNDSYRSFVGSGEVTPPGNEVIKDYVVIGASYFLKSYSDFLLFFERVEVAESIGFDYNEVGMILDRAIEKMEEAREAFMQSKREADVTPYNPEVIEYLQDFDYKGFQKENHLVESIFEEVKSFLEEGQIREMYGKAVSDIEAILDLAGKIRASIDVEEFPTVAMLWDLDEGCSRSLRFGQYTSRVFQEVKTGQ